jgi:ABC-2 type transport system ATP-binding protein
MDEPTDGLDPNQKFQVRRAIADMAADKAIIISTHILEEVDAICGAAMIIDRGQIVAEGTPSALAARSRYSGTVTLTLAHDQLPAAQKLMANVNHQKAELVTRGEESTLHIFASDGTAPGALLADMRAAIDEAGLAPRALALETGRLDDVFGGLTGKARPTAMPFETQDKGAVS